ncbi:MAG TPA: glycogen/starch synthase, partial [Noviherbaspirillum sp.]|nr:glycogen/starch synthase [Noviherbaspirillum sp.]
MRPRVLLVASEAIPLIKTGGLADVVASMANALRLQGVEVTLLLPAYPAALAALGCVAEIARLEGLPAGPARLLQGRIAATGVPVLLLENAGFSARSGNPYVDADGNEYADNAACFAALAHAAVRICAGATPVPVPHVVHANDWHAALIPSLLRAAGIERVGTVLTVHNLAFQGNYPLELGAQVGLPPSMLGPDVAEFWGRLSFLKAGICHADRISIVSHSYAQEVLTPRFGCGLDGALQARREAIVPIPNGVDLDTWNAATDLLIARRFTAADLASKAWCKRALLRLFDLPVAPHAPLLALGSRITHQKMADVALEALPQVLDRHPRLQVVVLGCGDHAYED